LADSRGPHPVATTTGPTPTPAPHVADADALEFTTPATLKRHYVRGSVSEHEEDSQHEFKAAKTLSKDMTMRFKHDGEITKNVQ
jgi:hypothetical protein